MNAYVFFAGCAAVSAVAAGCATKARSGDNELIYGVAISVFFGLAAIALPIVIALQSNARRDRPHGRELEDEPELH